MLPASIDAIGHVDVPSVYLTLHSQEEATTRPLWQLTIRKVKEGVTFWVTSSACLVTDPEKLITVHDITWRA